MAPSNLDVWAEPLVCLHYPAPIVLGTGVGLGSLQHLQSDLLACRTESDAEEALLDVEVSRVAARAAEPSNLTALLLGDSRRLAAARGTDVPCSSSPTSRGPVKRHLGTRSRGAAGSAASAMSPFSGGPRASSSASTAATLTPMSPMPLPSGTVGSRSGSAAAARRAQSPYFDTAVEAVRGGGSGRHTPLSSPLPTSRGRTPRPSFSAGLGPGYGTAGDDQSRNGSYLGPAVVVRGSPSPLPKDRDRLLDQQDALATSREQAKKSRLWNVTITQLLWRQQHVKLAERKHEAVLEAARLRQESEAAALVAKTQEPLKQIKKVWKPNAARARLLQKLEEMATAKPEVKQEVAQKQKSQQEHYRQSVLLNQSNNETIQSRIRVFQEGIRISEELNDRDAEEALVSFSRYDEDCSGTLELVEIRAVLADLGLLPENTTEKAAIRRTLVNFVRGTCDGESDDDGDFHDRPRNSSDQVKFDRCQEEHLIRSIHLTTDTLHDFISWVRARLKATRSRKYIEAFRQYDLFEIGHLDLQTLGKILHDLQMFGPEEDQKKTEAFFFEWLAKVTHPNDDGPEVDEFDFDAPEEWYFGTESLRTLLLGADTAQDGPWRVNRDSLTKHVTNLLSSRTFDQNEFEVFVNFLQVAKDHVALEKLRSSAEDMGVTSTSLFLEFRHELVVLQQVFESFDRHLEGEIGESHVWMALNSLGIVPQGRKEKVIFKHVLNLPCWMYSPLGPSKTRMEGRESARGPGMADAESGRNPPHRYPPSTASTSLPSSSPLAAGIRIFLELPNESEVATVAFQGFLTILSHVRSFVQSSMKEDMRPLFECCLRRRSAALSMIEDPVIGIREVSMALEELCMAPTSHEEQAKFKAFLEEANEWGFSPLTLDFNAFVRLIRRVREWRAEEERQEQRKFSAGTWGFREIIVQEYRVAFDILDEYGTGELEISGVRKIFKLLHRQITSDELRTLFAKVDGRHAGRIRFLEFLELVHTLDKPISRGTVVMHDRDTRGLDQTARRSSNQRKSRTASEAPPTFERTVSGADSPIRRNVPSPLTHESRSKTSPFA